MSRSSVCRGLCTLLLDVVFDRRQPGQASFSLGAFPQYPSCGESLSSQAVGAVPGEEGQTTTDRRLYPRMTATLNRMFPRRNSLVNVKPDTLIRWLRKGFQLL